MPTRTPHNTQPAIPKADQVTDHNFRLASRCLLRLRSQRSIPFLSKTLSTSSQHTYMNSSANSSCMSFFQQKTIKKTNVTHQHAIGQHSDDFQRFHTSTFKGRKIELAECLVVPAGHGITAAPGLAFRSPVDLAELAKR